MSDGEPVHRERSKSGPIIVVGLLLFLPILYVLSPPFAYLLVGKPLDSSPVCRVIYAPLLYLNREYPTVHNFYQWYDSLFPWAP